MQERVELKAIEDIAFSLEDITVIPPTPRMNEPITISGKVKLLKLPFVAPYWVIVTITFPEKFWEEVIPIWGSPEVREMSMVIGGDFEITYPKGFDREGEFDLAVRVYAGPTMPVNTITLPPFPPVATYETTFTVLGEVPPEEIGFSLTKPTVEPTTSPDPGTDITIFCPVTSECTEDQDIRVKCIIYEGSALPGHGTKLKEFTSELTVIRPGETKTFDFSRTTVKGTIDRRDIEVEVWLAGKLIKQSEWDDVYYVGRPPAEADIKDFDFKLTKGTYDIGAKVPFTAPYDYKGPEQDGQLTISIGTGIYPTFNPTYVYEPIPVEFPAAGDWETRGLEGNITLPDMLEAGQTYSVRAKLETLTVPTQETDTDWSAFDIKEIAPPTSDIRNFDFRAQTGTYKLGDSVPFDAPYEYKGKAQDGWLTISLGTGVSPSFFTKHTFPRERVSFDEAMDWTSGRLTGSFTLPTTLEAGQTYNVRAKLETDDGKQETDTDWGVITIEAVAPPKADIKDFDFRVTKGTYAIGDRGSFSAPYDYKGMKQSGQLVLELGTGIYPTFSPVVRYSPMPVEFDKAMDWESRQLTGTFPLTEALEPGRTYSVRAKLETLTDYTQETDTDWGVITIEEVAPPGEYTLTTRQSPAVGWITKEPDKAKYSYGEVVKVTSYMDSWAIGSYAFSYWDCDGEWLGTANPINFMVLASHTLTAHYRRI